MTWYTNYDCLTALDLIWLQMQGEKYDNREIVEGTRTFLGSWLVGWLGHRLKANPEILLKGQTSFNALRLHLHHFKRKIESACRRFSCPQFSDARRDDVIAMHLQNELLTDSNKLLTKRVPTWCTCCNCGIADDRITANKVWQKEPTVLLWKRSMHKLMDRTILDSIIVEND